MRQLRLMNESIYNNVIDALISEFGKDIVLSREFNYNLTQSDLKKIFNILNLYLFENKINWVVD